MRARSHLRGDTGYLLPLFIVVAIIVISFVSTRCGHGSGSGNNCGGNSPAGNSANAPETPRPDPQPLSTQKHLLRVVADKNGYYIDLMTDGSGELIETTKVDTEISLKNRLRELGASHNVTVVRLSVSTSYSELDEEELTGRLQSLGFQVINVPLRPDKK